MSARLPGTCTDPTCDREEVAGGRCAQHPIRPRDDNRPTSAMRGYSSPTWRRARAVVLRRDPWCVECGRAPANVADHHPRSRRQLLADGVSDPDDARHMRGICQPCHRRKPRGT